jgi:hypothetical protein
MKFNMTTKKLLVAFDPKKPDRRSNDFLAVVFEGAQPILFGVKSKKAALAGLMIYLWAGNQSKRPVREIGRRWSAN